MTNNHGRRIRIAGSTLRACAVDCTLRAVVLAMACAVCWGLDGRIAIAQECPLEIGHCETPVLPYQVAVSGAYAFVVDTSPALRVVDVSTPSDPVEVAVFDTWGWGTGVAVSGEYGYLATLVGLRVVDLSSPTEPVGISIFNDMRDGRVVVSGPWRRLPKPPGSSPSSIGSLSVATSMHSSTT